MILGGQNRVSDIENRMSRIIHIYLSSITTRLIPTPLTKEARTSQHLYIVHSRNIVSAHNKPNRKKTFFVEVVNPLNT